MRRASHEEFNMRACEKYQFFQLKEAALNVLDIIADPDSWVDCLKRYVWVLISLPDVPLH